VRPRWPHRLAWMVLVVLWLFIAWALMRAWDGT
jgi:hypothetical protein